MTSLLVLLQLSSPQYFLPDVVKSEVDLSSDTKLQKKPVDDSAEEAEVSAPDNLSETVETKASILDRSLVNPVESLLPQFHYQIQHFPS